MPDQGTMNGQDTNDGAGNPQSGKKTPAALIAITAILAILILAIDIALPLGLAGGTPYFALVLLSLWAPNVAFTVFIALVGTAFTAIGFFLSPPGAMLWMVIGNRLLAVFAIWVTAALIIWRKKGEIALRRSEHKFRSLVDSSDSIIWSTNATGEFTEPHPSWERFTGQPFEEYAGSGWLAMIHPEDRARIQKEWNEAIAGGKPFKMGGRCRNAASFEHHHVSIRGVPLSKNAGPAYEWVITMTDVDELVRARKTAISEKEMAQRYLDIASVILVVINPDETVALINKKGCEVLGYSEEEIRGRKWFEHFLPKAAREETRKIFHEILEGNLEIVRYHENPVLTRDGDEKIIAWNNSVVMDDGGNILSILSSGEDITGRRRAERKLYDYQINLEKTVKERTAKLEEEIAERKKVENALLKSEQLYRAVVEDQTDLICRWKPDGTIAFVNEAFCRYFGKTSKELTGSGFRPKIPDDEAGMMREHFASLTRLAPIAKVEHRIVMDDGEVRWLRRIDRAALDDRGNIAEYQSVAHDITSDKRLRQQLIQAEKLSSIGIFVSGIAHELNNPLTAILGFSREMLSARPLPAEAEGAVRIIAEQSARAASIVKSLLRFTRKSTGERQPVEVAEILEASLGILHQPEYDGIKIVTEYSPAPITVMAESGELQQVFLNILLNAYGAIKNSGKGGTITVSTKATDNTAFVIFENDGPHIPEEDLEKIFDPFFTSRGVAGTGLGLSISYGIIMDHNGTIRAENIYGKGVRFTVTLPLPVKRPQKKKKEESMPDIPAGLRVLLVEDDEGVRLWLTGFLLKNGIFVKVAENGQEALKLIEESEFDAVISDIKMPGMSGFELGERLSEKKPAYAKKLILITGLIDQEVDDYCSKFGCSFVTKPFKQEDLLRVISEAVTRVASWQKVTEGGAVSETLPHDSGNRRRLKTRLSFFSSVFFNSNGLSEACMAERAYLACSFTAGEAIRRL